MKFTDGMWLTREGYTLHWAENLERYTVKDDREISVLLTKRQNHVGDSLNTYSITGNIQSPAEGVIATKFTHWDGEDDNGPFFEINRQEPHVDVIDDPKRSDLRLSSGPLSLSMRTSPNDFGFAYSGPSLAAVPSAGHLTGHSFRSVGFVSSRLTDAYAPHDGQFVDRKNYMLIELDLSVHEKIYGLGERFGPFVKNGQTVDLWNEDGGTSSEQTYKNIPFFISSRGYGVFINHPGRVMLEVQSERTTRVNVAVEGESLEYMIIAGPSPKEILNRYTRLTGRPPLPPAWSYGLWLTTSFQTDYSESNVTSFLDGLEERDIPLSAFHLDALWMKTFQWCDFQFDDQWFPDPGAYIARLKARGLRLCVWMNPFVAQASPLFAEGKAGGYFIMRAGTRRPTVFQWDQWQPGTAVVDFTNPAACAWFSAHLHRLMDAGVDSFKTDFGERIPFHPSKVQYHDGSDPVRMHNYYSLLYNKCVWECVRSHPSRTAALDAGGRPENPVLFARSATAGGQAFPVHWGGDCESTFPALAETIRGGLSLALSGFGFWAHDIGGFEGLPDPALYKRWVQFGLLSSHSRLHGSSSYRVPWMFEDKHPGEDEWCSRVLREAVRRKAALMPYLLRQGLEAHQRGTPVMRPLLLEFPDDVNAWNVDTQYMLGSDLMVAPVLDASGWVQFYVPRTTRAGGEGARWRWWFDTSKTYEEGQWYTETHDFTTLPLLIRPGAVISYNPSLKTPEDNYLEGLQVLINGPLEGAGQVEVILPSNVHEVHRIIQTNEFGNVTDLGASGATTTALV